jgi:hypothetical protein
MAPRPIGRSAGSGGHGATRAGDRAPLRERSQAEGRVEQPDVFYREDEIRIVAYVTALPGMQTCPGNPSTPAVFVLPEPIGARRIVDAGEFPV